MTRHQTTLLALLAGSTIAATALLAQPGSSPAPAPAEPTKAPEPAKSTEPGKPSDPGKSAEPSAPAPAADASKPADAAKPADGAKAAEPPKPDVRDALNRRVHSGEPTVLAFKAASISELLPFIVESTGKVVLPQQEVLARRVTIVNDRPLPRAEALDLVFLALQQIGVAVVETPTLILLRDEKEVDRQIVPVLGPDQSTLERTDMGTVTQKVFTLRNGSAANLGEIIKANLPDYAKLAVDLDSNQVLITGPIALLQRMERLINSLDKTGAAALQTETFRLRYADADQVAANIRELFSDSADLSRTAAQRSALQNAIRGFQQGGQGGQQGGQGGQRGGQPGQQGQGGQGSSGTSLRVTSNRQQNTVTVLSEPQVLTKVRDLVNNTWDRAVQEDAVTPRVFILKYSDPIKIRDTLEALFGVNAARPGAGGLSQGVGRLAGQYSFQAVPEASKLIVVAKSPDNLDLIAKVIDGLDQPRTGGLPLIVELKHATAEDLSEQLNALLAQEGTLAQVRRVNTDLSNNGNAALSPFASTSFSSDANGNFTQSTQVQQPSLSFWWQRARPPTDNTGASTLVSKVRIVPVQRQNAVMVLAPAEYAESVVALIQKLDRPGRQVLISAVIAELSGEDATAVGLRWANSAINPTKSDNALSITSGTTANNQPQNSFIGQKTDILPGLFNTSVLNVGANVSALLQLLNQKTKVSILSEPRIYTGDNQEAVFFDGQDIPFITQSQTSTTNNGLIQSFDYRAVGIQLRARPRITPERDVDLKVNLQLSSIQPQATLFGGFIIDRRETTTQLIVQDGQTVVISGILRSEDSDIKRKVPLLGDIPLIGAIFNSVEKTKTQTELVAFITPIVVVNPDDATRINTKPRERLEQLRDQLTPERSPIDDVPIQPRGDAAQPASATQPAPAAPAQPASTPPAQPTSGGH
jgi:type II secretion system protein D